MNDAFEVFDLHAEKHSRTPLSLPQQFMRQRAEFFANEFGHRQKRISTQRRGDAKENVLQAALYFRIDDHDFPSLDMKEISAIVNTESTPDSTIKCYSSRDSMAVWSAFVACIAVIAGGSSLAARSFSITGGLLLGTAVVWGAGYWVLSENSYFISSTKAGFKDIFRKREVLFEEIRSVTKRTTRYGSTLVFVCNTRTVTMPLDPVIDQRWFSDVKTEILKRGLPISSTAFGFPVKEE